MFVCSLDEFGELCLLHFELFGEKFDSGVQFGKRRLGDEDRTGNNETGEAGVVDLSPPAAHPPPPLGHVHERR